MLLKTLKKRRNPSSPRTKLSQQLEGLNTKGDQGRSWTVMT